MGKFLETVGKAKQGEVSLSLNFTRSAKIYAFLPHHKVDHAAARAAMHVKKYAVVVLLIGRNNNYLAVMLHSYARPAGSTIYCITVAGRQFRQVGIPLNPLCLLFAVHLFSL